MPPPPGTPLNDMRYQVDEDWLFDEITTWYGSYRKSHHIGIIVEAKTDEGLYGGLFVRKNCVFFHSNGWQEALPALQKANTQKLKGVISIIDADFRRIEDDDPKMENLFMTDCHDAEMMMINSPAWEGVLNEYANNSIPSSGGISKLDKFEQTHQRDIKTVLLETCKPISCLILLNHREKDLGLKFKNYIERKGEYRFINYKKILDTNDMSINVDKLINIVEEFSKKQHLFKHRPKLKIKLNQLMDTKFDLLELCNGHHFINVFVLILKNISNKKATREDIETNLRIAYRPQDFQQTNLYNDLKNWQNSHIPPYHLLN